MKEGYVASLVTDDWFLVCSAKTFCSDYAGNRKRHFHTYVTLENRATQKAELIITGF